VCVLLRAILMALAITLGVPTMASRIPFLFGKMLLLNSLEVTVSSNEEDSDMRHSFLSIKKGISRGEKRKNIYPAHKAHELLDFQNCHVYLPEPHNGVFTSPTNPTSAWETIPRSTRARAGWWLAVGGHHINWAPPNTVPTCLPSKSRGVL